MNKGKEIMAWKGKEMIEKFVKKCNEEKIIV